ncbi:MAG: Na+/H+ antiporter NhaC family protein, partial [Calditrichaeota bacterium]|nr:Na+/H+ antiporter NhaC family protein [Calditrichota bacterium]
MIRLKTPVLLISLLLILGAGRVLASPPEGEAPFSVKLPQVALSGVPFSLTIHPSLAAFLGQDSLPTSYQVLDGEGKVLASGQKSFSLSESPDIEIDKLTLHHAGSNALTITVGAHSQSASLHTIPAFLSLVPPLLAILIALISRQVIVALFFGVWIGVTLIYNYNLITGFFYTFDKYLISTLANADHVYILVFSLVLGGMVGVISKAGGTQGIVERMSAYAKGPRGGQVSTWLMGILIFFDDYANTLIVGNTMRPLTDRLRISREKLSYLVDSTAAPVANIALVSTWIGYEISLINDSFQTMGVEQNAYLTFIKTIPLNFYPLFSLAFGLMIAYMLRDFGPMWHAETRARQTGHVLRADATPLAKLDDEAMIADENTPKRSRFALIPVAVVILTVSLGLLYTGWDPGMEKIGASSEPLSAFRKLSIIIGESNSFSTLMWAAFLGSLTAIVMATAGRVLKLTVAMEAWVSGIRAMTMAAVILSAAWMIGDVCGELFTGAYVLQITSSFLLPQLIPLFVFITAAVIAFATGTSWGTMAILMPIAIPLAHQAPTLDPAIGEAHAMLILLSTTAAVLAGATFGDHCSP